MASFAPVGASRVAGLCSQASKACLPLQAPRLRNALLLRQLSLHAPGSRQPSLNARRVLAIRCAAAAADAADAGEPSPSASDQVTKLS
jgi:hypothetical protein